MFSSWGRMGIIEQARLEGTSKEYLILPFSKKGNSMNQTENVYVCKLFRELASHFQVRACGSSFHWVPFYMLGLGLASKIELLIVWATPVKRKKQKAATVGRWWKVQNYLIIYTSAHLQSFEFNSQMCNTWSVHDTLLERFDKMLLEILQVIASCSS